MERKLTTIVAMEVVGYSHLMEVDEKGTLERLKWMRAEIAEPAALNHAGRIVKLRGDGVLLEFASVVGALQYAVDVQQQLVRRSASVGEAQALRLRIGIHLGDVIVDGEDLYGDGVNVASRLESLASPGGIVISKQVHDHIGSNVAVRLVPLGEQAVKNISRPIEAFRVERAPEPASTHVIRFRDCEIDTAKYELRRQGVRVPVEPQVFDLLVFLARNRGRTVTKEQLFSEIWRDRVVSDAALSSQVKAARRAVADDGVAQHTIATVHGRGFRFVAPVESDDAYPTSSVTPGEEPPLPSARKPSVAVLPFANFNADPTEDYFAEGMAEDITTALSKNRWLTVVARNSAFAFRGSRDTILSIGQKLAVDYLVTGSVRKAGTRFRTTVQVVDAETEHSVWSERFDREVVDVFELQEEVSHVVAARIETELGLTEQKKAERRPRKNLGAWDLYQLGVAEFYKFTRENNEKCQELLRQAIKLDPTFAAAHARLAYAIVLNMVYFDAPTDDGRLDEALAGAKRAIELDDEDANGYFTLGRVCLARREYDLAIDALRHSVTLNPALAVTYCGLGDSLAYEGRLDEAIEQFDMAIRLSPHDPFRWAFCSYRSLAHLFRGEYAEAASWARKSTQIPNAHYWAKAHLVAALGHLGDENQAQGALKELLRIRPGFTRDFARERLFYLKRSDQIETYLEGLRKAGVP